MQGCDLWNPPVVCYERIVGVHISFSGFGKWVQKFHYSDIYKVNDDGFSLSSFIICLDVFRYWSSFPYLGVNEAKQYG